MSERIAQVIQNYNKQHNNLTQEFQSQAELMFNKLQQQYQMHQQQISQIEQDTTHIQQQLSQMFQKAENIINSIKAASYGSSQQQFPQSSKMADTAYDELEREIAQANLELSQKTEEIKQLSNKIEDVDEIDSKSIFVGNVDYSASTDDLRDYFQQCGEIERVTIPTDKTTRKPKGYAYIEFASAQSVDLAQGLNDSSFKGRNLKIMSKRTNIPGQKPRRFRKMVRRGFMSSRSRFYRYRPF